MKICVDFTSALADRTGVGTYTRELVRGLLRTAGEEQIRLAAHVYRHPGWHRVAEDCLEGLPARAEVVPNRLFPHGLLLEVDHRFGFRYGDLLFGRADVFHGTNFLAPACRRARVVVTVHDLAFVRHGATLPVPHRYHRYLRRSLSRAHRVIAVSESTRRDVAELLDYPPERIDVVPEAGPTSFPILPAVEFEEERRRLGIPDRYFLFVGTLEPRKNLLRLLQAYQLAARRLPGPPGLVLAGRRGWYGDELEEGIARARRGGSVIHTGFVPEPLRNSLYQHSLALVYPSFYEGFGLPVLEAFQAGTPVLTSTCSSLPEVAGDAALLVDPMDVRGLALQLERLADDESLRRELTARGRERLTHFSWDHTARRTLEVYRRA